MASKSPHITNYRPLASLPRGMLIRSLFIAGISSKRFLLEPSLKILSFLSKPDRGFLLNVDKNPIVHGILKTTFYNQFCAGETGQQTKETVRQLKDLGFKGVILTYARETVFDHRLNTTMHEATPSDITVAPESSFCPYVEEWRIGTLETIQLIDKGDFLAVKLSGAGPSVTEAFAAGRSAPQQFLDALDEICVACKDRSIRVIVDAESQHFQKGIASVTLDLMRRFNLDNTAVVYNTYQAYLRETPQVLAKHLESANQHKFTLGLKLVRGAYILSEDRSLIHNTKQETDDAYNCIATGALKRHIGDYGNIKPFPSLNLFLASHNKLSVVGAHRLHQDRVKKNLPTVPIGFGQLHGMSDEVSFSLLSEKNDNHIPPEVFKCSTWGSMGECLGYLLRRAIENRDAIGRTSDEYAALRTEAWRRIKSGFRLSD